MRKVLFFAFLFVSFSASAQWTIINGKQRFAKGLGIPVSDTVATLLNDSAQIVLRPQDSAVYYKLHGKWMKLNGTGGGGSTPNLQQVTDQGATTTNYVGVQGLYVYDSFSGGYQIIDGNIDGGLNFYNKNGDTLFHYGGGGIAGYDMGIGINRPANGDRAFIRMNTGNNEYLLPSTSGTLALTSDISYPDTTTIATHHYVDSSIVASVPTLNEVLSNGHITYGKEIDMYDTIVNGSEIYISPLYQGAFIGMKDSTNKYIEIGINNNAYNTPSLYFQTKNRGQFLNYIDSSFGNLFLPYQNNQVDTLATRHYVDSSVSTKLKISDTANKWVNNITRTLGKDSIIYYIGNTRYAIKDSVGTNPPASGYYLSISDSTTQDNPTANTPRAVKFNTTDLANGFSLNTQTAVFVGTINNGGAGAGTILTVTSVTSGTLKVGMVLTGGSITAGTFISAFTSGTGGIGTYVVSVSQLKTSATYTATMTSQIVCANTGVYNLQFSSQMDKTDAGVDYVDFWLRKNGTDITASAGVISLQGNSPAYMMAAWNYVIQLVAGDTIELYWGSADINMSIKAETSQTTPLVHPAVQSTIFTITQQAGILAGTGITAINSLTGSAQTISTGTSGTDFAISSSGTTHTLNLPTASATNRGALSSANWTTFNSKIAPSDTATMLSKYFNNTNYGLSKSSQIISVDTSTLSNKYHRLNDSLTYFTKYRSDTMRTNIYTAINGKQASGNYISTSDTSTMLSKYLRKTDTATLSARIDTKIGTSDTSVFQRKTIASYSFVANNTNASANVTTQSFRDSSGTYSGTPTFTGTTAPSGTTNHTYRWVQVGKQVTVWVNLVFGTAGSAITACTIPFPSTLPTPASPTGISGANAILYTGSGSIQVDGVTLPSGSTFVSAIQINSSNNGYNVYVFRSSGSSINPKNIYATIQYYAQ